MSVEISVEEAKELKRNAEREITKIVLAFETRTGVRVENIELINESSISIHSKIIAKI